MNSDTGSTVHSDMKSTGFSESSLSSTSNNQDVSNQEQASINNNGSTVQQDMQSTGFTSNASSSNDTSSSNQTVSSQEYASINDSGSTVQQDMQSSGFTSSSSSNDDPSPRIVETNVDTTSSPLIQQEAARSEMQTTQQQVASTSTNSEPISSVSPSQNVVSTQRETRTGGEYLRDRINSNQVVQRAKRTYQISRNTGLRMRNRNNRND
ncbi:hypothetical protein, partial [Metabacillus fastidiosus]|uniref:hypothetical protein n=1 Tax=Metabacillus fastidiosus TaxID=1458 RepID=UPI003D27C2EC